MTREVTAVQERQWKQRGGVIMGIPECEDGAGNTIECEVVGDGGSGYMYCAVRHVTTGAVLDDIIIRPANGMKADTGSIWLRGDRLRVRFGNHMPGAGDPEDISKDRYDWVSPHIVPILQGDVQMGRPGGHSIIGEPGGGEVDYERIEQIVKAGIDDFDARLGGQAPREDIEGKMKDAIREEGVLRLTMSRDDKYAFLGQFIEERAFIGTLSAHRRMGTYTGPLPGEPGWQ